MCREYKIVPEDGHYKCYMDGEFFCSGDSFTEVAKTLEKELAGRRKIEQFTEDLVKEGSEDVSETV